MPTQRIDQLTDFLKVLADESRLRLLGLLAQREYTVGELASILGLREPTVSHHLSKLARVDLVTMRAEGTSHHYRLNTPLLHRFKRTFLSERQVREIAEHATEDAFDRKVLASFLDEDRLIEIPASRKKRQVILRWLADKFEFDRAYPQKELNQIIKRHHPDTATLRRELLASKLMKRDRGVYERIPA